MPLEPSAVPLVLSSHYRCLSANAPAWMWELRRLWENTPTPHRLKIAASGEEESEQPKEGSLVMSRRGGEGGELLQFRHHSETM